MQRWWTSDVSAGRIDVVAAIGFIDCDAHADAGGDVNDMPIDRDRRTELLNDFSATLAASAGCEISGRRMTNSSPPWRDTVSHDRTQVVSRAATALSGASPTACQ